MTLFVLEWRFGSDREARLAVRPQHREYLEELRDAGHVVAAGPWADDSGALIVYSAGDAAAVENMLENDPYVSNGVGGERTLREWSPIIAGAIRNEHDAE
ncbi:MAG TPA: YciI family protein [Solirubrobacteraceae bacterium]|nr:YciI family protein [Solirubrobacteraceae bacterium]